MKQKITIGIAGNPNCGKTTLFNALTGTKQRVGNWPGVTVERKTGNYSYKGKNIEVVDLPGIYSLSTSSLDEQIARDYILKEKPDLIINIVDASNLERNLYLTIQLIEMKTPLVVVLNMMDMVKQKNIKIKIESLSKMLDCPVVCTVANKAQGIPELRNLISETMEKKKASSASIYFPEEVEEIIDNIISYLKSKKAGAEYNHRWMAIKLLEEDIDLEEIKISQTASDKIKELIGSSKDKIEAILGEEIDIIIADSRYGFINSVCKGTVD